MCLHVCPCDRLLIREWGTIDLNYALSPTYKPPVLGLAGGVLLTNVVPPPPFTTVVVPCFYVLCVVFGKHSADQQHVEDN